MWMRNHGDQAVPRSVAEFEKHHPDIKVKVSKVDDAQFMTKLANAVRAGTAPDIVRIDVVNAPLLATQGVLTDITDRVQSLEILPELPEEGITIGQVDGRDYSVPAALNVSQMFWNKKLYEAAGLDPETGPTTLTEVKEHAEKISALDDKTYGFSSIGGAGQAFTGFPSAWADGGTLFTEVGPDQEATFNNPAFVDMVSWYQDMWQSGLMQPTDEPNQDPGDVGATSAREGHVGIIFTGANMFAAQHAEDETLFGSAPGIPGNSGEYATFLGGDSYAMPGNTKHQDQAWQLIEWLISSDESAKIITEEGWIPPAASLAAKYADNEWDATRNDSVKNGYLPATIAYFATVNDANGPWAINSNKVIFEGADAESSMTKASSEADALIAEAYDQVG